MLDNNVPKPWQGQTTLVLALAAAAIGLGNLFRFPFLMGANGGAAFFVAYLATLLLVVAPILVAEVMLGSHGRGSPLGAIRWASDQSGRPVVWSWLGVAQAVIALLLAAKLLLLAVWMVDRAAVINTGELSAASALDVARSFSQMLSDGPRLLVIGLSMLAVITILVALGPQWALGIMGWLALPAMAVAMLGLLDFSLENGDLKQAGEFLFSARSRDLALPGVMAGMSSALFTLGAGLGIGLCFGARTPRNLPLLRSVVAAVVIDLVFAVAIALVVVPLLFATNTKPVEGMALVYVAIPYAFANLPLGEVYGAVFFGFGALASAAAVLALMEPAAMLIRRDLGVSRLVAAPLVSTVVLLLAVLLHTQPTPMSPLVTQITDIGIFTTLLLMALFVGWAMPRPIVRGELYREPRWLFVVWWELLRLAAPTVLLMVAWWTWAQPPVLQ